MNTEIWHENTVLVFSQYKQKYAFISIADSKSEVHRKVSKYVRFDCNRYLDCTSLLNTRI